MNITLIKKDLLNRGWSKDQIIFFDILFKEDYPLDFIFSQEKEKWFNNKINNYGNKEQFIRNYINFQKERLFNTVPIINRKESLLDTVNDSLKNNESESEFIKLHVDNFDSNMHFELFIDGSFKKQDDKNFTCVAGWIRDANNNPIIEFSKLLENKTKNFEIEAINYGIEILKSLNISNVTLYSDSFTEIWLSYLNLYNFYNDRFIADETKDLYNNVKKFYFENNINLQYIPREFNQHADNLSKIFRNYYENKVKIIDKYDSNFNNFQYYHNEKINVIKEEDYNPESFIITLLNKELGNGKSCYNIDINLKEEKINHVQITNIDDRKNYLLNTYPNEEHNIENQRILNLFHFLKEIKKDSVVNANFPTSNIQSKINLLSSVNEKNRKTFNMFDNLVNKYEKINFKEIDANISEKIHKIVYEQLNINLRLTYKKKKTIYKY